MCLAAISGEPRKCPSCGTAIATLRCGGCFHMNLPTAAACAGCGHALGLEPILEPDPLRCPDCKLNFHAFRGGSGLLRDCDGCGGQFVGHSMLKALLEQREAYGNAAPRPPRFNPLDNPVRYLPCPVCEDVMMRRNFGRSSGVIVDVCTVHGTWFDSGELPRVLAFVEAGGLIQARKRELEDARTRDRDARVRSVEKTLEPLSAPGSFNRFTNTRRSVELAEAGSALLDFVNGLIR